jgi:FAD/FMN-containing dehydrogenase
MKVLVLQLLTFASIANCDETDPSCKVLSGDAAWPSLQVWTTELPGVTPIEKEQSSDLTAHRRPDYQLIATKVEQVQSAIKFTAKYNIRLSIINSGVDFLGRSDAPSGLSLNVANFKGIRVAQSFTALDKGLPDVDYSTDSTKVNIIKPVAGKQAVVSFGAGMAGQELNNALHKSGLMIMAAATSKQCNIEIVKKRK